MEQFGKTSPTKTPEDRSGAYGVAMNEGRLLVVEWQRHLYLPWTSFTENATRFRFE